MTYPQLAGDRDQPVAAGSPLMAGQAPVGTDSAPALAAITQFQLCVLLATGVTPYVPATHTTAAPDKLVIAQVGVASGAQCPYWNAGKFNRALIVWPGTLNTYPLQKEALLGSRLEIGHVKPPSA